MGEKQERGEEEGGGGGGGGGGCGAIRSTSIIFQGSRNIPTRFLLNKSELSNEPKLKTVIVYLDLARP